MNLLMVSLIPGIKITGQKRLNGLQEAQETEFREVTP